MPTAEDHLISQTATVASELSHGWIELLAAEIERRDDPAGPMLAIGGQRPTSSVVELVQRWREAPAVDGHQLAFALRCASSAVKLATDYEKVDLVYTGPGSSPLRRSHQAWLEVVRSARVRLWVVSYIVGIGVDDVLTAIRERAAAGVEVNILIDHRTKRFEQSLERLLSQAVGCQLYLWPDAAREVPPDRYASLHAKCAVADGRVAFVSSANLTGWAMNHNLEVGYLVVGGPTPKALEAHLDALRLGELELIDA